MRLSMFHHFSFSVSFFYNIVQTMVTSHTKKIPNHCEVIFPGIGVDDTFVMCSEWHRTNPKHCPKKRVAETLSEAAVAITITSVTDAVSTALIPYKLLFVGNIRNRYIYSTTWGANVLPLHSGASHLYLHLSSSHLSLFVHLFSAHIFLTRTGLGG